MLRKKRSWRINFWRTGAEDKSIIFTFSSFASQEVNDSVECKAVESKPGNGDIDELAMTIYTKLRHLSNEKSSEEESEGNSEVTAIYYFLFPHIH